jgi:hypothetical protein
METYDNSDWKAVANGGTVKIATQKTFRVYDFIPRGTSEQISKACNAFFERKGIVYGESCLWGILVPPKERRREGNTSKK